MVPSVVVGYDASEHSVAAVRWAAREAARTASPLLVVHVWGFAHQRTGGAGTSWLGAQVVAGVQAVADEGVALAVEAAPEVHARGFVGHGPPAQVLVDHSRDARLVVLGRHGTGWVREAVIGSVAASVVQHAFCPVVVVPTGDVPDHGVVVVGVDGSAGADAALDTAAEHSASRGAALRVLTAWTTVPVTSTMSYWVIAYPDSTPDQLALAHAEQVQEVARARLARTAPELQASWEIVEGRASDVLTAAARGADLVVVGARGRGGLAGLLLGSVSRGVVRHSPCPVLVTRSRP
ncbi:universal stress protein [Cellulomonas soli]|uniref:Universal stress protein n=2 Tax=Cellulomonas soli TaxID=931535 RepID=A0A512P8B3_9CELL|nr:universal stress protein [Cellulomonas soli]